MKIMEIIAYVVGLIVLLYVMDRYFSGAKYNGNKPNLTGYLAVITGGNSGIGKQTVLQLAQQGCRVIIGARDTQKSQKVVKQINQIVNKDLICSYYLQLGSFESIRKFSQNIKQNKIDFLINNAGVMAIPSRKLTKQGHQYQYGINHLGHFYLTHLLWKKLNKSQFFRVINVASLAHKKFLGLFQVPNFDPDNINYQKIKYNSSMSYSRSKLYNVLFTHALSQKIPHNKGLSLSLHPGVVRTQLTRYLITSWKQTLFNLAQPIYSIFTKSCKQGTQTTLYCLFEEPSKLKNGAYYADCAISSQNRYVTKQNWDRLWDISQKQINIVFGQ